MSSTNHTNPDGNYSGIFHGPIFPEIFVTGKLTEECSDALMIADALVAWANCQSGHKPPPNFGHGMVLVANQVGTADPKKLMELAKKLMAK